MFQHEGQQGEVMRAKLWLQDPLQKLGSSTENKQGRLGISSMSSSWQKMVCACLCQVSEEASGSLRRSAEDDCCLRPTITSGLGYRGSVTECSAPATTSVCGWSQPKDDARRHLSRLRLSSHAAAAFRMVSFCSVSTFPRKSSRVAVVCKLLLMPLRFALYCLRIEILRLPKSVVSYNMLDRN